MNTIKQMIALGVILAGPAAWAATMEVSPANSNPDTYYPLPEDVAREQLWKVEQGGYLEFPKGKTVQMQGLLESEGDVRAGAQSAIYVSGTMEIKGGVFDMSRAGGVYLGGKDRTPQPGRIVQTGGVATYGGAGASKVLTFQDNGVADVYELKGGDLRAPRLSFTSEQDQLVLWPGAQLILDGEITANPYPGNVIPHESTLKLSFDAARKKTILSAAPLSAEGQMAEAKREAEAVANRTELIAQEPVCPIVLNPGKVNILLAVESACSKSISRYGNNGPGLPVKRMWIQAWTHPDESVGWKVSAPKAGAYELTFLLAAERPGAVIRVIGPENEFSYAATSKANKWDRETAAGVLNLPAGESTITLKLAEKNTIQLKLVELVEVSAKSAIEKRLADFRAAAEAERTRFKESGYGVMVQGGGWAYPPHGEKKPWPGFAEDFPVERFADQVESMGAKFVIWSVTWSRYLVPAPLEAVDQIAPGFTAKRDLLGELADAFHKRGIQMFFYYHLGHGERGWWEHNWDPKDRPGLLQENWKKIIGEMGQRYGTKLSGWFFDDDCVYCPSDYEELGAAARTGHPGRLLSYNPWRVPAFTRFQDIYFGETNDGSPTIDGIISKGGNRGLQGFHMQIYDGPGWGIGRPDQKAGQPRASVEKTEAVVRKSEANKTPVAFNLLIWEDGSMPEESVKNLQEVARKLGRVSTPATHGMESKQGQSHE